jgi:UDP-GlcNAc:undecaprenyl-phosphate/decaprenyl-phosphate GlcNAc-1-phosphate transferase
VKLYLLVVVFTAVVTFVLTWAVLRTSLRFRLYPAIRDRDVHTRPTPRLGGIAMFLGLLGGIAVASQISWFRLVFAEPGQLYAILGSALIIVVIGVADDIYDLSWFTKLAGQILAAGLLAWQGVQIVSLPIGGITVGSSTMSLFITIVAVVLVMNAVNFIDGLDGLVAGVALIANGVFFLYSYLLAQETSPTDYFNLASMVTAVLIGACAGFLPLNFRPAKLFMGDSGAMLVGLLMATSAISVTGQIDPATIGRSQLLPAFLPILLPFAILVIPLLDFTLAVARRLRAGKSPFAADRKHLHHRLLDMGHSHLRAVLIFYSWTAVISFGCLLLFVVQPYWIAFVFLGLGLVVCAVVTLLPLSSRYRRRVAASEVGESGAVSLPEPPLAATTDPEESPS